MFGEDLLSAFYRLNDKKSRILRILRMLEAAIFLQRFPRVNGQFFKTSFADIFRNTGFL